MKMHLLAAALIAIGGCVVEDSKDESAATSSPQQTAPTPAPAPQPSTTRIEVDLAAKTLTLYRDDRAQGVFPVAVGSKEWPTPTGEWTIDQVVFNPRWVPPRNESWAKNEKEEEPGDPDNPLGQVQLVYSPPNSIHGTNEPESIGKAVSHGSIRMQNETAILLAKQVMQAGGANKDEAWVQNALANKTKRQEVAIPNPIPIRVIAGAASAAQ